MSVRGERMIKQIIYILGGISLLVAGLQAEGASTYKKALDKKIEAYVQEGVVVGGRAGAGFSLLSVRRDLSPKLGMERVILDLGDLEGRPLKGKVGYFQASIETNPPRLVLDLAQLSRSAVTEGKLRRAFTSSPYVRTVELVADPEDRSASLVIYFKQAMAVEIFEMPSIKKASRIVIDLKDTAAQASAKSDKKKSKAVRR